MTPSFVRLPGLLIAGLLLAGCALPSIRTGPSPDEIAAEWSVVVEQAGVEVQAGRYASADQLLASFQQQYPGAPQSSDATVHRALYKLDPTTPGASSRDASVLLDAALAGSPMLAHRGDLLALRRIASALETKPSVVTVSVPGRDAPVVSPRADVSLKDKDDEIARLKDDVARANAELERIRRRVATPKP
jgi:hypothetical protein